MSVREDEVNSAVLSKLPIQRSLKFLYIIINATKGENIYFLYSLVHGWRTQQPLATAKLMLILSNRIEREHASNVYSIDGKVSPVPCHPLKKDKTMLSKKINENVHGFPKNEIA